MDRWDLIGGSGALSLVAGIWGQFGWPAAAMVSGLLLLAVYVIREAAAARTPKGEEG